MNSYYILLKNIILYGEYRKDRTGFGTLASFGNKLSFDLVDGFPLLTTKKIHFKSVVMELLWFLRGDTNIKFLNDHGVKIWDHWANTNGDLGPIYGSQWRNWGNTGIDQIQTLITNIKKDPCSRRHLVSAWNVSDLDSMALPPCHYSFQCYVDNMNRLSMLVNMRSCDVFIGLPFNIASYALLMHIIAVHCDLEVNWLTFMLGDTHLYLNHIDHANTLLARTRPDLPTLYVSENLKELRFDELQFSDFKLIDYNPHEAIKADVAI